MAKAFSENEIELIRQKLIESCQICWERYGYRKTNVAQLCEMAGISTGAFYAFYPSKEVLFVKTAETFSDALLEKVRQNVPEHPTKRDLGDCMKMILSEVGANKWLFSLRNDYEFFQRKLPPEYVNDSYRKDLIDIGGLIALYGMKPKVSIQEITAVIYTLYMSLYFNDIIGEYHQAAVGMLIDGVLDQLFE